MNYNHLKCGATVSKVGLGSPRPFRNQADDRAATTLIRAAIDFGITFFDTAPAYGYEATLASGLSGLREQVLISTKTPHRLAVRAGWSTVTNRMVLRLEESLRLLKTDRIDFYFLHAVSTNQYSRVVETVYGVLEKQQRLGKVRFLGVSEDVPHDKDHIMQLKALSDQLFDVIMVSKINRLAPINNPRTSIIGMLADGALLEKHRVFDVILTGTSNINHLKSNIHTMCGFDQEES